MRSEHLEAAVALWEFSEASCKYIFGDATGNPDADVILQALRGSPNVLSRTEINNLFKRHKAASIIGMAINSLRALGLLRKELRGTEGRPSEVWFAV